MIKMKKLPYLLPADKTARWEIVLYRTHSHGHFTSHEVSGQGAQPVLR